METFAPALFLALAILSVTNYLKQPLVNTPRIRDWLLKHGLAYLKDSVSDRTIANRINIGNLIVLWWLPYVTFTLGAIAAFAIDLDIVSSFIPGVNGIVSRLLTAAIVGGGANVIHDVTSKR